MNILITGFEPFGGADVNPSWLAVKNLPEKINGYDVVKIEVPVVFGKCGKTVLEAIEKYEPNYVINVGQAGGRDKVTPELVAINMRIGKGGDNEGNKPDGETIKVGGKDAYFSNAPVYSLCKRMADEGYKVGMSMSAGAFICNETFYTVAEALYGTDVLFDFVHVPFIPEQGKTPSMPLEEITSTLLRYIEMLTDRIEKLEKMNEFFDSRLEMYDEHMLNNIEGSKEFYGQTAKALPKENGCKILDLGCGTGLELDFYFRENPTAQITGIDLAEGMLGRLKEKFTDKNIKTVCGSYFDVPFGKKTFDGAVSVESLHHFTYEEKLPMYKKLCNAIKDGGYFILTDYFAPTEKDEKFYRSELLRMKKEQNIPDGEFYHYDTPITAEHEIKCLKEAGFSNVEILEEWSTTKIIKATV